MSFSKKNNQQKKSLEVRNLSYAYQQNLGEVLTDINFDLFSSSINIIIGPNGSGKSTLLKSILGFIDAKGSINFYNSDEKLVTRRTAHIGYVPQKFNFDTTIPITVEEFLKLTLINCKKHKNTGQNEIIDTLKSVDAHTLIHKKLGDLSGGQLQRVVLARAFLHHPQLLILDEPESGVDIEGEKFFYEVLKEKVKNNGLTALIASHEMEIVSKYADQVLCLNKTLICSGTTTQVLTTENFEKLYGLENKLYLHKHQHHE